MSRTRGPGAADPTRVPRARTFSKAEDLMRRRLSLGRALASAVLLALPAVACTDEPPTAVGVDLFPGALPTTFQVVLPADSFARRLGTFSGYTGPGDVGYALVANQFGGTLQANTLARFGELPVTVTYTRNNASRTDTIAGFARGTLVLRVDTVASTSSGPIDLEVREVGQAWDPATVSWTMAVDTAGGRVPWTQPGGTPGPLLGRATIPAGARAADSVLVALDSLAVARLARTGFPGVLVTAGGAQGRIQLNGLALRTFAHPRGAAPDTVVQAGDVQPAARAFVFTPDQPTGSGALEVGGIRSARTLLGVTLPETLPVCSGGSCTRVPIGEVTLNEVSLLLQPTAVPAGYQPVAPVPIALRRVSEPELGRRAPLGSVVNDPIGVQSRTQLVYAGARFVPGDSVLAIPFTGFAASRASSDSTSFALALVSDPGTLFGTPGALSFGPAWFLAQPRLRIVYTLSARPRLP